jgi:ribosomal protein S8
MIKFLKTLKNLNMLITIKKKNMIIKNNNSNKIIMKNLLNLNAVELIKTNNKNLFYKINYIKNKPLIKQIIIFKKKNLKYLTIQKLTKKNGCFFLFSTSIGILDQTEINKIKIGGYLIAKINF